MKWFNLSGGDNHVTIQFDGDDNHTIVTTTEKDIEENDVARLLGQKEGWVYMLSCLKSYLEYGNKIRGYPTRIESMAMFNFVHAFNPFYIFFKYQNKNFARYGLICLNVTIKVSIKDKRWFLWI